MVEGNIFVNCMTASVHTNLSLILSRMYLCNRGGFREGSFNLMRNMFILVWPLLQKILDPPLLCNPGLRTQTLWYCRAVAVNCLSFGDTRCSGNKASSNEVLFSLPSPRGNTTTSGSELVLPSITTLLDGLNFSTETRSIVLSDDISRTKATRSLTSW